MPEVDPSLDSFEESDPAADRRFQMPRWVWGAVAVFWLGYLV